MPAWQAINTPPAELGESPFWHPLDRSLYWADIAGRKLHRWNPLLGMAENWSMPSEPGCFAPARSGGFIIALRDRIARAQTWGGKLQTLCPIDHDTATTRSNDGKCDAQGRFWVGTMYEPRTSPAAGLWAYSGNQGLVRKPCHAVVANCLAFSPDGKTVYWADTSQHTIWAWNFDPVTGAMTQQRVFKQFAPKPVGWLCGQPGNGGYGGRPDGAAIDDQGNLWVAMYEGKRVVQLSPAGHELQSIETPVTTCTMPAFGGDDMQTLYLTSARHNRSPSDLACEPLMGRVFSLRVKTPGQPVSFYED